MFDGPDTLAAILPRAWLAALLTTLLLIAAIACAKPLLARQVRKMAQGERNRLADSALRVIERTRQGLLLPLALYAGGRWLELPAQVDGLLRAAAIIASFAQIGLWLATLVQIALSHSLRRSDGEDAGAATGAAAFGFVANVLVWSAVALLALSNLGVDVTALVAGLGIGGIAIALAVQSILGDLFASFSIVIDKPFALGDFIVVDGFMGTVERVGIKTTRLRSLSGEQLVFANSDLLRSRIRNYKRMRERRAVFGFGVVYDTAPARLERIPARVREIVESRPLTRFERAHFTGFGDSSLDFEVVYWMLDPDYTLYMDTQQAINLALLRALRDDGVEFAFPTRTLLLAGTPPREPVTVPTATRTAACG